MFLHTKVIMLDSERHVAGTNHNSGVAPIGIGIDWVLQNMRVHEASALGVFHHVAAVMRKPSFKYFCACHQTINLV